jgi:exosome complex component RRP45
MVSRMLDKSLRRSRAIDTEGLCIIVNQKVWTVRVDVRVLNHDGNLIDCASIAAVAALLHFRRPDVTISGESVIIVRDLPLFFLGSAYLVQKILIIF